MKVFAAEESMSKASLMISVAQSLAVTPCSHLSCSLITSSITLKPMIGSLATLGSLETSTGTSRLALEVSDLVSLNFTGIHPINEI